MCPLSGMHPSIHPVLHNPLVRRLSALALDMDHYAVFGSGPMLAHGLRTSVSDLDIIARGAAWERAVALGDSGRSELRGDPCVRFWKGRIEVFRNWVTDHCSVDELIDNADVIAGIRFVQLPHVLAYKRILRREKDADDIVALEGYLSARPLPVMRGHSADAAPVALLPPADIATAGSPSRGARTPSRPRRASPESTPLRVSGRATWSGPSSSVRIGAAGDDHDQTAPPPRH
jgi:hypothetical protein